MGHKTGPEHEASIESHRVRPEIGRLQPGVLKRLEIRKVADIGRIDMIRMG